MNPAFEYLTQEFTLLKLRFYVQFQQDTQLPAFKGSMLHGLFGHALKAVDERAFFVLYGVHEQQQPKPYMVCPSDDLKTHWHKNELYHFDIVLFGQATQLADSVIQAIKHGQRLGLGAKRTPYTLISLCSVLPVGLTPSIQACTLADWLGVSANMAGKVQREIALHCKTPIRIKSAGKIIKQQAPALNDWLNHIMRRLKQLSTYWVLDNEELFNQLYTQRPVLGDYEVTSHLYFEDWQRYSHKEQSALPFGGLQGQVSYFGDIQASVPWLIIGQHIQLGGKTTFGLGAYQLIY